MSKTGTPLLAYLQFQDVVARIPNSNVGSRMNRATVRDCLIESYFLEIIRVMESYTFNAEGLLVAMRHQRHEILN